MGYEFDGASKVIGLTSGTTALVLADLYAAWKDWVRGGNAGYLPAMATVGGEETNPITGTIVPLFLFLENGWKIRPQEADHTLHVTGGTLIGPAGADPFVDTIGVWRVRTVLDLPVQAIGYSTSGSGGASPDQVADAVWSHSSAVTLATRLAEAWARLGLDPSRPLVQDQTAISFGAVLMALTEADGSVTVTRQ